MYMYVYIYMYIYIYIYIYIIRPLGGREGEGGESKPGRGRGEDARGPPSVLRGA